MNKVVLGALVGDSASVGLHWIYSQSRIAEVTKNNPIAFHAINELDYEGVPSYFAHEHKSKGDLSHYGELVKIIYECVVENKKSLTKDLLKNRLFEHFKPGGVYIGYADTVIKHLVYRILGEKNFGQEKSLDTTLTDDQNTVFTLLAPFSVAFSDEELLYELYEYSKIMTVHKDVYDYLTVMTNLLNRLKHGLPLKESLYEVIEYAPANLHELLKKSIEEEDFLRLGKEAGLSCHLPEGLPVVFNILSHASSFKEGIEQNILVGGDSCGRAIYLGALLALVYDIPEDWIRFANI